MKALTSAIIILALILIFCDISNAANVTLRWDPNQPTPQGYRIFMREKGQSYDYSAPVWTGSAVTAVVDGMVPETTYYFVVRAFEGDLESADSEEVSYNTLVGGMDTVKNPRFPEQP